MNIKIIKDGPYLVTGKIALKEKIIVPNGEGYLYEDGRELPQSEQYALCRCGKSKNPPFCDGAHAHVEWNGEETDDRSTFAERAKTYEGPELDLLDDGRCAYGRFCHREGGKAWHLTRHSDIPGNKEEAIIAAQECPTGRLVPVDKEGNELEPCFEPTIEVLQDPEMEVSGPLFVKGRIPLEGSDGFAYEVRNRYALCRCGKSKRMPYCDATHVTKRFQDRPTEK